MMSSHAEFHPKTEAEALEDSANEVRSEMRSFLREEARRRYLVPRAALVGLVAGLVAVAFRLILDRVDLWRNAAFSWAHHFGAFGAAICVVWGAIGAGSAAYLVRTYAPETSGSGIPHLKGVLHHLRTLRAWRVLIVKFGAGVLSLGSGLVVGREGPTLQMGGALGQIIGRKLGATARERETFIAAGAGAGLAAAFNAPLAGLIFVLEELQGDFAPGMFAAALVASVIADVVGRTITGQLPAFHVVLASAPSLEALPVYLVMGVLAGLVGIAFNRSLLKGLNLFARLHRWPPGVAAALVGGTIGLIGFWAPQTLGGGHGLAEATLGVTIALSAIPLLFLLRFVMTIGSYGTGVPGGFFAPLLVLGALLGLFVGLATAQIAPGLHVHPQNFAVVGMAAIFAATTRAPLTGIVLIIEMTNGYALILPLLAACLTAYGIADWAGEAPIYEALLGRELLRGQEDGRLDGLQVLETPVAYGAVFDNRRAGELDLPHGCVLVSFRRKGELVPVAPGTLLRGGDILSFVLSKPAERFAGDLKLAAKTPVH